MGMLQAFLEANIVKMPEEKLTAAIRHAGNEVLSWIGEGEGATVDTDIQAVQPGDTSNPDLYYQRPHEER